MICPTVLNAPKVRPKAGPNRYIVPKAKPPPRMALIVESSQNPGFDSCLEAREYSQASVMPCAMPLIKPKTGPRKMPYPIPQRAP